MAASTGKPRISRAEAMAARRARMEEETRLYVEERMSIGQIAAELDVSNYCVHRDLVDAGVPRRAPGFHHYEPEAES